MNPKQRLTLEEVKHSAWLFPESVPQTPLMTPDVLGESRSMLGFKINMTMSAFNKAAKSGFKLNSVLNAPLAQRRKNKKSSTSSGDSRLIPTSLSSDMCVLDLQLCFMVH